MRNKKLILFLTVMFIFTLSGCRNNNSDTLEARSMARIHEEEGYPVTVIKLEKTVFTSFLEYTAAVTGIAESSTTAMVSGNIEKIYFKTGDYVEKDTVIIDFPVNTPGTGYSQAKAAYENSMETYRRIEKLYASNGISRQDYDNAGTGFEVAKANWETVKDMVHVKAPVSGIITRLDARENNNAANGDPLFTVSDYSKLMAGIWISEKDYSLVKPGLKAEALWENRKITGKAVQVDLSVNPDRMAFGAILEFENPAREIKSGVTAVIRVIVYENPEAVAVERKYLSGTPGNMHVFTAEDGKAVMRSIGTGRIQGQLVEITEGLKPGDLLIAEGSRMVSDNSRIRIVSGE